jgi:7,8-dihydropterin-6-yl-methyl-4-(beta-D-ribofuranosyl)aminobenzene 5'-phosphate synthase
MKVSITTLVENLAGENRELKAEHGLSFFVEVGDATFLFDTGSSKMCLRNAKSLGIPPAAMRSVLISHGHHDHSGGYKALMSHTRGMGAQLFVKAGFFNPKYGIKNNGPSFLGNAFSKEELVEAGVVVHEITENVVEIFPDVYSIAGFERECPFEKANPRFVVDRNGSCEVDDFSDEQILVIKATKGLVVLLGCSHPGVVNILQKVKTVFQEPIHAVIGGTHLIEADSKRIEYTTDYLLNEKIPNIMFCHCSGGPDHLEGLISRLGNAYGRVNTGTVVSFQ